MGTDNVWCAVPVYNNGSTLRQVVEKCLVELDNVLVVDDGSTDADVEKLLDGLGVKVIGHERNMGKGAAILTALRYVESNGGVYMITIDADGQHDPGDIGKFLPVIMENDGALVVGCRDFNTPNVPKSSRFGRRFANFWP
jgi:glycosyltransferase involved in cell wall biosynthesis